MVETTVSWAAYFSAFSIISLVFSVIVRKEDGTGQYKFLWSTQFVKFWKVMIAVGILTLIAIGIEEFILQPYLIQLYEQHQDKVNQLLLGGIGGLFMTIWLHIGLTKKTAPKAIWATISFFSGLAIVEGLRILPLW